MPELPEMETYKRLLNENLKGQTISKVVINREKSVNIPATAFINEVENTIISSVERRAKHLVFNLNSGKKLVLHLMLGGLLYYGKEEDSPDRTKQIIFLFKNENLYFIGLRLGYLHLYAQDQLETFFQKLGPEPLNPSFTTDSFEKLISNRRSMLKTLLVNQSFIAGIGNCYSDEICFESKLLPNKKANELLPPQKENLYKAIKKVLLSGIAQGGYMDNPFTIDDSLTGGYKTLVYDRKGLTCYRCNNKIKQDEVSSKKCFYCPICQS